MIVLRKQFLQLKNSTTLNVLFCNFYFGFFCLVIHLFVFIISSCNCWISCFTICSSTSFVSTSFMPWVVHILFYADLSMVSLCYFVGDVYSGWWFWYIGFYGKWLEKLINLSPWLFFSHLTKSWFCRLGYLVYNNLYQLQLRDCSIVNNYGYLYVLTKMDLFSKWLQERRIHN